MARKEIAKSRRRAKPLYHSAKISEYQFMRVLWQFTLDRSAAEAARHVRLSANSISASYTKLRRFFFECGLFNDPYRGDDPRKGLPNDGFERVEQLILEFHFERAGAKHGAFNSIIDAPDYHFAESNWRFDYFYLWVERGDEPVQRLMYAHLLEFIRRFGPVGPPSGISLEMRLAGTRLALDQTRRTALWLERNSPAFRDPEKRAELRKLRER